MNRFATGLKTLAFGVCLSANALKADDLANLEKVLAVQRSQLLMGGVPPGAFIDRNGAIRAANGRKIIATDGTWIGQATGVRIARLEFLVMTVAHSHERTCFLEKSRAWQASGQRYLALATTLRSMKPRLEDAAPQCIGSKNGSRSGDCSLSPTTNLAEYDDLRLSTELD